PDGPALTHGENQVPWTGPNCSICGGPMQLFEIAGIWVCNESPKCPGVRSIGAVEVEAEAASAQAEPAGLDLNCPICTSLMVVQGMLRPRISCPLISCGFSLDPRLSAGILRILARKQTV